MKRSICILVCFVFVLTSSGFGQVVSETKEQSELRSKVIQFQASKKRVIVFSRLGEKTKGTVESVDDQQFTIIDGKSGTKSTFKFTDVKKVRKNSGLSTTTIIVLAGVGATAAILLGVLSVRCRNEGGCL